MTNKYIDLLRKAQWRMCPKLQSDYKSDEVPVIFPLLNYEPSGITANTVDDNVTVAMIIEVLSEIDDIIYSCEVINQSDEVSAMRIHTINKENTKKLVERIETRIAIRDDLERLYKRECSI